MAAGVLGIAPIPISEPTNVMGHAPRAQCTGAAFRCLAIHMHEPAGQRARELVNTPEFATTTAEKESGSPFGGTEESDRTASPAPAEIKVCSGAVLLGGSCPDHQATGPLPQPRAKTNVSRDIVVVTPLCRRTRATAVFRAELRSLPEAPFSTPTGVITH
jgi:hypothetical protein